MGFRELKRKIVGKATALSETSTSQHQEKRLKTLPLRSAAPALFPDGIEVLYSCEDATVDICFVHGLTGDRIRTWKLEEQPEPWPKTILPCQLKKARVLTYGYDAYVLKKSRASVNRLIDHATNLLNDLTTNRATNKASSRPIIFVAHSLGGLVCKETLLMSRNNPESHLRGIFNQTKAIIFMGTPHMGSWMAEWAKIPATGLGIVKSTNKSLLQILETDNQFLESIHVRFLAMIRDLERSRRQLHVTCFFEELPLLAVGEVVSKDSATFPGYNSISIHADHREMTRFASAQDTGFQRLLGELTRWEEEISAQCTLDAPPGHSEPRLVTFEEEVAPVMDSDSEPESSPFTDDKIISIALDIFNIQHNTQSESRARKATKDLISILELQDLLEAVAGYRSRQASEPPAQRDKRKALETRVSVPYKAARSRCLRSLAFPEMGVREASIARPAESTCTWIYTDSTYTSWEQDLNALLWIKGKPGSGKSTLMKSLSQKRRGGKPPTNIVYLSFFFNARGSAVERTPVGLYITLLYNLLSEVPLLMSEFLPLFLEKEFKSPNGKVSWQLAEITDFFHAVIGQPQPKYIEIMIDALDECEEDEVREVVLGFEKSIADARRSKARLKACWSSRYYPNISLRSEQGLELRLDKRNHDDICQYVAAELTVDKDASFVHIRQELISRANGVFLWAVLVTKRLIKGVDQGKDETQLKELFNAIPAKLDDLFDEIFGRTDMPADSHQNLLRIAQWILCAFRPLTLIELFTALSLQKSDIPIALDSIDVNVGMRPLAGRFVPSPKGDVFSRLERQITDLSGGLFEVIRSEGFGTRVQVIHESVREFFLGPKGLELLKIPTRELFMATGHKALALGCFQALLAKEFDSVFKRPKIKDATPITEVWKFLAVPWDPPENTFLTSYVQNFVFEHFALAKDHFCAEYSTESPFESLSVRRRAFENFLRLCCSHITEEQCLPTGFSAHVQKLATEAAGFDLKDTELSDLMTFLNNLSACSSFLTPRHVYMYQSVATSFSGNSRQDTYLALFYIYPRSEHICIDPEDIFMLPAQSSDYETKIKFCFGMTFQAPKQVLNWDDRRWQIPKGRSMWFRAALPTVIQDWRLSEDIGEFPEFAKYTNLLRVFPKAKLETYSKPTTLCLLLRHPESDNVLRSEHSSDMTFRHFVLGCGRGSLPVGSWWRKRQQGRERDIFEADTEGESESEEDSVSSEKSGF